MFLNDARDHYPGYCVPHFLHFVRLCGFLFALLLSGPAVATTVLTSDFSDPGNVGSIGGGILSGSTRGSGTIDGVAGRDPIGPGFVNTYGWFYQGTLPASQANPANTLSADVTTGAILGDVDLPSADGEGVALAAGLDLPVAASTSPGAVLGIELLPGTMSYRMTMRFETGATPPSGDVGVRLAPGGLLTADLLPKATFSNVQLEADPVRSVATFALGAAGLLLLGAVGLLSLLIWKRAAGE